MGQSTNSDILKIMRVSIILSLADNLLAGGPEEDGVFVLRCVASLHVTKRRVRVHDACVTEILEGHQVFGLIQPARTQTNNTKTKMIC